MNPFELTKRIGVKEPLSTELVARVVTGDVRTALSNTGPDAKIFMGPGQPIQPAAQDTAYGRQFDYGFGSNIAFTPRQTERINFYQLRELADSYDLIRLLIETRKDQLVKFEWQVAPRDAKKEPDDRCKEFSEFLQFPDRRHNWQTWLRALLEEMLVTDAACVQPVLTRGGDLYSLDWFDGATLHMLVDETGRTPLPPDVAYQQILKGIPAVDYSSDDLIYLPRNRRVNRLYGYSPVEQILMTVNIALRRQLHILQYFTEGNIPEALVTVPKEWTPEQIRKYQEMWDVMYTGDTAARRHLKFIPFGTKYYPTKEEVLKDAFDEWLARICCYAFSLPAAAFVKDQNRATAESAKQAALEEGLHPLMAWVKDMLDLVLWKYKGWGDLQFVWKEDEPTSAVELSVMNSTYVKAGIKSVDEARQDLGLESIGMPNAVYTAAGVILVKDILNPAEAPPGSVPGSPPAPLPEGAAQAGPPGATAGAAKKPPVGGKGDPGKKTVAPAPKGDAPPKATEKLFDLHVHMPRSPDVLVDIGATTINASFKPGVEESLVLARDKENV